MSTPLPLAASWAIATASDGEATLVPFEFSSDVKVRDHQKALSLECLVEFQELLIKYGMEKLLAIAILDREFPIETNEILMERNFVRGDQCWSVVRPEIIQESLPSIETGWAFDEIHHARCHCYGGTDREGNCNLHVEYD